MKKAVKRFLDVLIPAALSLVVAWLFILLPLSLSIFNVSQSLREQYDLIDAFTVIRNTRTDVVAKDLADNNITIIDLSDVYDRGEIASIIDTVLSCNPLAVGFDVALWHEKEDMDADARLASLMKDSPVVVIPCQLFDEAQPGGRDFRYVARQFFVAKESFPAPNEAAANVDKEGITAVVRHFTTSLSLNGTEIDPFAVKLLKTVSPQRYAELMARGNKTEHINFRRASYTAVTWSDKTKERNMDLIPGRVVLIGDLSDEADKFNTPIESRMPGVVLHAMTLDSMMRGAWIDESPDLLSWLVALVAAMLLIPVFRIIKRKSSWAGVLLPMLQTVVILLFAFLSYWLFARFNYYIRPFQILLSVGFLDLADNLYKKTLSLIKP